MREFVIGTRGSRLALRQTDLVVSLLRRSHPDLLIRTDVIQTTGDRDPDKPIGELSEVGFFVKELELALVDEAIDGAVHSMKDLPSTETPGLLIGAIPARGDPRDVLVARGGMGLTDLPPRGRVGTSSARRAAALLAQRPDLVIVPIRGNVDTRIRKVDAGEYDAVCLAAAGLLRAGLGERISQWFPIEAMVPAPGQGALGVQVRLSDDHTRRLAAAIDDPPTRVAVLAERVVLRRLEAGCRLPLGAHAVTDGVQINLSASIASTDGRRIVRASRTGPVTDWLMVANSVADELAAQGAELLPAMG